MRSVPPLQRTAQLIPLSEERVVQLDRVCKRGAHVVQHRRGRRRDVLRRHCRVDRVGARSVGCSRRSECAAAATGSSSSNNNNRLHMCETEPPPPHTHTHTHTHTHNAHIRTTHTQHTCEQRRPPKFELFIKTRCLRVTQRPPRRNRLRTTRYDHGGHTSGVRHAQRAPASPQRSQGAPSCQSDSARASTPRPPRRRNPALPRGLRASGPQAAAPPHPLHTAQGSCMDGTHASAPRTLRRRDVRVWKRDGSCDDVSVDLRL